MGFLASWLDWHEWLLDDIRFDLYQKEQLKAMLIEHPHDEMGDCFRSCIKSIDKNLARLNAQHKLEYGDRAPIRRIREEIQKSFARNQSTQRKS